MSLVAVQLSVIDCQHSSGIVAAANGGDGTTAIAVAAAASEVMPESRHCAAEGRLQRSSAVAYMVGVHDCGVR